MPIDFPTRKLADRATTTPTAPAADDTLQGQTALGTDRVFLLGNLAGLAPLTIANDQAPYFAGGAWGSYSLTAAGRALSGVAGTANTFPYFSAANVAAGRAAIGAADASNVVDLTSAQTITGSKTATTGWRWNLLTNGSIQQTVGGSSPALVFRSGDPATGDATSYRSEIRGGNGIMQLLWNSSPGVGAGGAGVNFADAYAAPNMDNTMTLGAATKRWTQVFATNATINTSDARLKTELRHLREAEFKAASAIARLPAVWRWIHRVEGDEQNEPEGREARKHFGPTVQAAMAVMEAHGLDPFAYSFICYDHWEAEDAQWSEWDAEIDPETGEVTREAGRELVQAAREAGDRYSFRKEELLCFLVAAMARQHDELEARVAALEAKLTA